MGRSSWCIRTMNGLFWEGAFRPAPGSLRRCRPFLERRELAAINVGANSGTFTVNGVQTTLDQHDCPYIPMGSQTATFGPHGDCHRRQSGIGQGMALAALKHYTRDDFGLATRAELETAMNCVGDIRPCEDQYPIRYGGPFGRYSGGRSGRKIARRSSHQVQRGREFTRTDDAPKTVLIGHGSQQFSCQSAPKEFAYFPVFS